MSVQIRDGLLAVTRELIDLLDELADLCPRMCDDDPIAPAIRDVIAKARGAVLRARAAVDAEADIQLGIEQYRFDSDCQADLRDIEDEAGA